MVIKPPLTPPYFIIAFAIISALFSLLAFGIKLSAGSGWRAAFLDLISMVVPVAFAWLSGTLPLKTYMPSLNVAGPKDVSKLPTFNYVKG